ncbi:Lpp/OprI family alanine-zipper lipoprotein [Crenobacter sp. SG2303]|uniref:Lpp/OprI family alanine-zipper lipoprotein n=1 Tax=Crenobacter oryzisoli TaxID=3056844 RepID=A0ABT7XI86_9NEIS|nr:Lpp/OprI family alanine-zipper lipoprotein [Crenobacter sp. SG2303]MDN0073448.1 Lpp/OprI family alanine-zipper lipoprotein [Crenobacter sp. SG2303]
MLRSLPVRPLMLASAACASLLLLGGCATNSDLDKVRAQAVQAQQTADQANQAAAAANQKADQALNAANQANQTANDTNEKLNRMFKKSMMK